ncbi:MAG: helix-turn-helix domain-containing protein [Ferruginibacter sp.]
MEKTIFISLPIEDLQTVIIDCVNSCLKNNKQGSNDPQTDSDELLTVQDAAKFLSLSVPTIYGLISKKQIPVMKRSKRCYFSKAELMNYLKQGRKKTFAETDIEAKNYINTKTK